MTIVQYQPGIKSPTSVTHWFSGKFICLQKAFRQINNEAKKMFRLVEEKLRKFYKHFKKQHKRLFVILNYIDHLIQSIGEVLKFFQLEGIHHIIDKRKHVVERFVLALI